ncbi:MAG: hypothetical protein EBX47_10655 [Synechococcaceae bacterium WB8_1B_057]|nr:hypothetical protein [Synechococcaceae bacterium WB8_1B_057]
MLLALCQLINLGFHILQKILFRIYLVGLLLFNGRSNLIAKRYYQNPLQLIHLIMEKPCRCQELWLVDIGVKVIRMAVKVVIKLLMFL